MPFTKAFGFDSSTQLFFSRGAGRALQRAHTEFVPSLASLGSTEAFGLGAEPFGLC